MKKILKRNNINILLLFAVGVILIALFGKTSDLIGFATGIIAGMAAINLNIIIFGKFMIGSVPPVFYIGYFILKLAIIGVIFYISMKAGGSPIYIAAGITCGIASQVIAILLPVKI